MKYKTSDDFRQALETRIRNNSQETGMPLVRLRKQVAFDRFLLRLFHNQPDAWLLKGGFALQLRLGDRARTTKDIDLLAREQVQDIHPALQAAGFLDLDDWFSFEVAPSSESVDEGQDVLRFDVQARLASRTFESFHIDVGIGDPVIGSIEYLTTPDLLAFAGLKPARVPCYPISQQIAEKLHAYTRPHGSGQSTRVKDYVDMLLLAEIGEISRIEMIEAIDVTFEKVKTHEVPSQLPPPPRNWSRTYRRLSGPLGLEDTSFDEAFELLQRFLDPALEGGKEDAQWVPSKWGWF